MGRKTAEDLRNLVKSVRDNSFPYGTGERERRCNGDDKGHRQYFSFLYTGEEERIGRPLVPSQDIVMLM